MIALCIMLYRICSFYVNFFESQTFWLLHIIHLLFVYYYTNAISWSGTERNVSIRMMPHSNIAAIRIFLKTFRFESERIWEPFFIVVIGLDHHANRSSPWNQVAFELNISGNASFHRVAENVIYFFSC